MIPGQASLLQGQWRLWIQWAVIPAGCLAALGLSLSLGRYPIPVRLLGDLAWAGIGLDVPGLAPQTVNIFWNIRVPRILMALVAGAGISTAGAVFQALFKNPLAAPDILGVTAGACFGAALSILALSPAAWVIHAHAFGFGLVAVFLAQALAGLSRDPSPMVLVITGIVVSALFRAGLSFIMYMANPYDQLTQIVFWTMGSFHTASWAKLSLVTAVILPGMVLMTLFSWRLNLMTLEDEEARSMGMNTRGFRIFYILVATLMVASAVASVGTIAWVGLIVPHMARFMAGPEYRRLIPATALTGGIFLMVMDSLARSLMLSEIPISIVTSLIGAPFLGFLVIRAGRKRRIHGPEA